MDFDNYPKSICVLVSFIMSPLNAMDDRKYQAHKYSAFSSPQYKPSSTLIAVHVSSNQSPGITFSGIGETATVYENNCGSTK